MKIHPLKYERELRGWSQAKVAEEIGTTARTVSRWEHGLAIPYPYFREQLCTLFGKNAVELGLIPEDEDEQEPPEDAQVLATPSSSMSGSQTGQRHPDVQVNGNHSEASDTYVPFPNSSGYVYDSTIPVALGATDLIGRDALLAQLKRQICTDDNLALNAINGLPGVGKTALAVALATDREVQEHFRDGILWVGLGTHPNVLGLLAHWGMLLNVSSNSIGNVSSAEAWGIALHEAIGTRRMLLIIDDAWKIEEALAFQVGGPHCAHLLTTRIPQVAFAFARERAIEVPQLTDADGLTLLARFAPEIVTLEAESSYALVRSVGALPLALTLMGKYLATQAFTKQPRRLHTAITQLRDAEQRLLVSAPTPITARSPSLPTSIPLSLHAAITVSDQQISDEARRALQALSVLPAKPSSFSEEMALAVAGVAVEVLDEISDAGLLDSSGPGRYTLHQTISDYAKIQRNGDSVARDRFIDYCVAYVKAHQTHYELLDPEISNILAAFDLAYQTGRHTEFLQGVYALINFLQTRGLHSLITELLQQSYTVARSLNSPHDIITIACRLGEIALVLGANIQAEDYLQEGLALARQVGDQTQICRLLAGLGERAAWRGDLAKAEAYCEEGLALARLLGRDEQIMILLTALAWTIFEQQDYVRAEAVGQEALGLARKINYQEYISQLLAGLGWAATALGNYAQAEAYYQEGLTIVQKIQNRYTLSLLLAGQGWLAGKLKNYAEAEAYTREALLLGRQMDFHELIYRLLTSLGWLAEKRKAYTEANTYYQEALLLARQQEKFRPLCMILSHLGTLRMKQQQFEAAAAFFHEMLDHIPEGNADLVERAQSSLARITAAQSSQSKPPGTLSDADRVNKHPNEEHI
jgi:tetratricopeptide (TPR) repeat protein/DNA-binding XRE family transcriptional regulator